MNTVHRVGQHGKLHSLQWLTGPSYNIPRSIMTTLSQFTNLLTCFTISPLWLLFLYFSLFSLFFNQLYQNINIWFSCKTEKEELLCQNIHVQLLAYAKYDIASDHSDVPCVFRIKQDNTRWFLFVVEDD